MAKVYRAPEDYHADYRQKDGESVGDMVERVRASEAEYIKQMSEAARKASPGDALAGERIRFPVADGYAEYIVWSSKPLRLIYLAIGDAWQAHSALIRGLRIADVRAQVKSEKALTAMFSRKGA